MLLISTFLLTSLALLSTPVVDAASIPGRRQLVEVGRTGTIVDPDPSVILSPGASILFDYTDINECFADYTPVDVYLLKDVPDFSKLNATGQFSDYIYYFGGFMIHNFDLPPTVNAPPPSLTIPNIGLSGTFTVYFTIVETDTNCASGHLTEYGLTYATLTYSGTV